MVSERNLEVLKEAIMELANDMTLREKLSQTAIKTARRYHDARIVREQFRLMLAEAAA